MKDFLIKRIMLYVGNKIAGNGNKSYCGAAGKALIGLCSILSGIVGMLGIMFPDQGLPTMDEKFAMGLITGGIYAITSALQGVGQAHKMDKAAETAAGAANGQNSGS